MIFTLFLLQRPAEHAHLSKGFLSLSGLQFRGHAFFSDDDVPVGSDTIEYGWQMEIQCGKISSKLTLPQVTHMNNSDTVEYHSLSAA